VATTSTNLFDWTYFTLNGYDSPGSIPRGGVRGFRRETGWDKKKGKGTAGATLTLTTLPPCEGEFTIQLIGPGGITAFGQKSTDFAQWDQFVANALAVPPVLTRANDAAQGLTIYYPAFAAIGLTKVVVVDYSPPEHVGKNLYLAHIKLCEWRKPPPVNIVSNVSKTKPDGSDDTTTPAPQDPRITALQAQIALANAANNPNNGQGVK
jgi:hypothetical protein